MRPFPARVFVHAYMPHVYSGPTMIGIIQKWLPVKTWRSQTNENQNCVSIALVIELKTNYLPNDAFAPDTRRTGDIDRHKIIIRHNDTQPSHRNRVIVNRHGNYIPP